MALHFDCSVGLCRALKIATDVYQTSRDTVDHTDWCQYDFTLLDEAPTIIVTCNVSMMAICIVGGRK